MSKAKELGDYAGGINVNLPQQNLTITGDDVDIIQNMANTATASIMQHKFSNDGYGIADIQVHKEGDYFRIFTSRDTGDANTYNMPFQIQGRDESGSAQINFQAYGNGQISIGTTSPDTNAKFHVVGANTGVRFEDSADANIAFRFGTSNTSDFAAMYLIGSDGVSDKYIIGYGPGNATDDNQLAIKSINANGHVAIYANGNGEVMRVGNSTGADKSVRIGSDYALGNEGVGSANNYGATLYVDNSMYVWTGDVGVDTSWITVPNTSPANNYAQGVQVQYIGTNDNAWGGKVIGGIYSRWKYGGYQSWCGIDFIDGRTSSSGTHFGKLYFRTRDSGSGDEARFAMNHNNFYPLVDNAYSLGGSSNRWSTVYAGTGSINTSDINTKQDIEDLSQAELNVATALKGLIKKYRFKDAVAEKGDDARIHVGVIAQDVQAAFEAEGLDPYRYGLFCSDTWWEVKETVLDEWVDDDGTPRSKNKVNYQTWETAEEAPDNAVEVTRLSVRYEELLAFIIAAM